MRTIKLNFPKSTNGQRIPFNYGNKSWSVEIDINRNIMIIRDDKGNAVRTLHISSNDTIEYEDEIEGLINAAINALNNIKI